MKFIKKQPRVLSSRQMEIIRLGALGMSNLSIADELGLAEGTVRLYFVNLRKKIGKFDRCQLPGIAILLGLISAEDITRTALDFLKSRISDPYQLRGPLPRPAFTSHIPGTSWTPRS